MGEPRSVEELTRLLRESEQRAAASEQSAAASRQRAEAERQRAEASEQQIQPTTFEEYIDACHSLVFSRFTVESNPRFTSKGSIPNPRDKWCPTHLRPWPDFLLQQRFTFGMLYDTFPTERRVFENRNFLAGLGNRVSQRKISDEKTLEYFVHNSVEDPVKVIINQLEKVEEVRSAFRLGNGIIFENHPHAISEVSEEVVHRDTPSIPPSTPDTRLNLNQLRPDQICVYRSDAADSTARTMIYVAEYKPPHKLTAPHLRVGLRPMDIYKEVANRKTIPTSVDPDGLFQYHAERLTAAAITQTYHYMIEGGLEFGLLTTGEATVFLNIDWREPETLLYHLAEPDAEVLAHPQNSHLCTAVGQCLAFTLMALGPPGAGRRHGQDERERVTAGLKTWTEDFESTLRSIPENERYMPENTPKSSPGYQPQAYEDVDRSPCRRRGKRPQLMRDGPMEDHIRRAREESSDDEGAGHFPDTPSPTDRRARGTTSEDQSGQGPRRSHRILARRPRGGGAGEESNNEDRPYCTQKCLLGLVNGDFLDPGCPNVASHRGPPDTRRGNYQGSSRASIPHPIDHAKFLGLLWEQLKRTLDDGITPLYAGGARSVLFKVTLLSHGYTFVSKGTVRAFIEDLQHEAAVYSRLQPIQGMHVPVFLGAIDLRSMNRIYYFDHRVYVVHMTFLSWGGEELDLTRTVEGPQEHLQGEAMRSLRAVHQLGVIHTDVRWPNLLLNTEVGGVLMIDFERALLLAAPRAPLRSLVPNKRRWKAETTERSKSVGRARDHGEGHPSFSGDIGMLKTVFWKAPY